MHTHRYTETQTHKHTHTANLKRNKALKDVFGDFFPYRADVISEDLEYI